MAKVKIQTVEYIEHADKAGEPLPPFWAVRATYEDDSGTRDGSYRLELESDATEEQIARAIIALYEPAQKQDEGMVEYR